MNKSTNNKLELPRLNLFWYFAYAYFQNDHYFNSFVAKSKASLSRLEDKFYKKEWEAIEIKKPIFIIGPHRSGTTILQQILCLHSEIATPRTYSDILDMAPILARKWLRYIMRGRSDRQVDKIVVHFESPQEAQGFIARYFQNNVIYNQTTKDDIENYMKKLLYLEGKKYFLWKVPYLTVRIPEIVSLYPDSRFIYLHRDPVTCINSKLKFISIWQQFANSASPLYKRLVGKHQEFRLQELGYFMNQANKTVNCQITVPDLVEITNDHLDWIEKALDDLSNLEDPHSRCFVDFSSLMQYPRRNLPLLFKFLGVNDETESILLSLENLGMPLKEHVSKLEYIPAHKLQKIRETCETRIKRSAGSTDWTSWYKIGQTPG